MVVSVIIPLFNAEKWIQKTLLSCLDNLDYLYEIIIVDDHSTDNSVRLIQDLKKNYPNLIKLFTNPSKGSNSARNFGFSKSGGQYIQWLDADDQINPGKFKAQVSYLENHPNTDIVYSDYRLNIYSKNGLEKSIIHLKNNCQDFLLDLLKNNYNPLNSYLYKRRVCTFLHQNKGWNISSPKWQDREYITMACIFGFKVSYVAGLFADYNRWNLNSISQNTYNLPDYLQVLNRFKFQIIESVNDEKRAKQYVEVINTEIATRYVIHNKPIPKELHLGNTNFLLTKGVKTKLILFLQLLRRLI